MSDFTTLMAAICNDPSDDSPRLIAADWLDEHGEGDRAEVIRVQCELDGPEKGNCRCGAHGILLDDWHEIVLCRHCALRRREQELLNAYSPCQPGKSHSGSGTCSNGFHWLPECLQFSRMGHFKYHRGFLHSFNLRAEDFLDRTDELLWQPSQDRPCPPTAQPVTKVALTTWPTLEWQSEPYNRRHVYRFPGREKFGILTDQEIEDFQPVHRREGMLALDRTRYEGVGKLLKAEWPWVEFTLPQGDSNISAGHMRAIVTESVAEGAPVVIDGTGRARVARAGELAFGRAIHCGEPAMGRRHAVPGEVVTVRRLV